MIVPGRGRLLVEPMDQDNVTKGGIVLPDSAKEKPTKGTVVSVGEPRMSDDGMELGSDYNPEDVVIYTKYSGVEVRTDDGKVYRILSESDIIGYEYDG